VTGLRGVLAALVLLLGATQARAGAASIARALEDEEAECTFLLFLCRQANRTSEQVALTPDAGATETLAFKRQEELRLRMDDLREAARVIRRKHGRQEPWCFDDPECADLLRPAK
jgi:hypothetical protein